MKLYLSGPIVLITDGTLSTNSMSTGACSTFFGFLLLIQEIIVTIPTFAS